MSKLVTLNGINNEELLNSLFSNEISIIEDIQGSKIWVNWNGKEFTIKTKSISSEPISLIDLAMQNYYNPAINYFNSLDNRVKSLLNRKWWFCFEYFPDEQPANIEYNRVPKNKLVLTAINKSGKYEFFLEELNEYARLFDVEIIPVVFQGKLTDKMIEAIKYFLNTSEEDLDYIFGEKSFAFFFYKILNPLSEGSFLMDDDFQKNIEKLIIRNNSDDMSFELLNPLYTRLGENNDTEFVEIYTLILINFLNFCQSVDLKDLKLKGSSKDEIYIYLICKLYNIYISEVKQDLLDFDFVVPEFFDKDKFKINTELILNKVTKVLNSKSMWPMVTLLNPGHISIKNENIIKNMEEYYSSEELKPLLNIKLKDEKFMYGHTPEQWVKCIIDVCDNNNNAHISEISLSYNDPINKIKI